MIWKLTEHMLPDELRERPRPVKVPLGCDAVPASSRASRSGQGFETFGTIVVVPAALWDRLRRLAELLG